MVRTACRRFMLPTPLSRWGTRTPTAVRFPTGSGADGIMPVNNMVEQDHRRVKRRTGPMLASRAFGPPGGPWPGWRRWRCWRRGRCVPRRPTIWRRSGPLYTGSSALTPERRRASRRSPAVSQCNRTSWRVRRRGPGPRGWPPPCPGRHDRNGSGADRWRLSSANGEVVAGPEGVAHLPGPCRTDGWRRDGVSPRIVAQARRAAAHRSPRPLAHGTTLTLISSRGAFVPGPIAC